MLWREAHLLRIIKDLTLDAWRTQRPGSTLGLEHLQDPDAPISEQLGADSLELFQIATRVAVFFELHQTGMQTNLLSAPRLGDWVEIVKSARSTYDQTLRFATSGSTGQPKYITHRLDHLMAEVQFWSQLLEPPHRVLSVVPSHHLYGFIFSILLPDVWQQAHSPNTTPPENNADQHAGTAKRLKHNVDFRQQAPTNLQCYNDAPTLLIGFPHYWRTLIDFEIPLPETVIAITSTAPCSADVAARLKLQGLQRLIQIYGSTETGAVGWRESAEAPYTLLPHWRVINAPNTAPTHLKSNESATDEVFPVQDELLWQSQTTFTVGPRIDNAVQVGGINVYPDYVARMLEHVQGVKQARVRLMQPTEGERLKAFIVSSVSEDEYANLRARIDHFCEKHLKPMERPRDIAFGRELPRTAVGKLADW